MPYDDKVFFESFYKANLYGEPTDSMTIGVVSEAEARFHYNSVENSIIRALSRIDPPPPPAFVRAWKALRCRERKRLVDVGSGTGHWIDFMRDVFFVREVVALEIAGRMAEYLKQKYAEDPDVQILPTDVADSRLTADLLGGPVDYVTGIGVFFHIVDDSRWEAAAAKVASLLKSGGLMIVSGEFGPRTRNVQFHGSDEFDNWRTFKEVDEASPRVLVNKRVRSLTDWQLMTQKYGLHVVDLVRSDESQLLATPENDILVLRRE